MHILEIITHPGAAHRDEVLASAVILAKEWGGVCTAGSGPSAVIYRRDPTEAELKDVRKFVVDIGEDHDPRLRNFDHHQFDREAEPRCALSLVLEYYGMREAAIALYPWVEFSEWLDARGPYATAEEYGMSFNTLMATLSPLEQFVIKQFEAQSEIVAGTPLMTMLKAIGDDIVARLAAYHERKAYLYGVVELVKLDNGAEAILVLEDRLDDPSLGMDEIRRELLCAGYDVAVSVVPDDRGEGYTLYRYADDERIDFSKLAGDNDILFAHSGGFVAKTKAKYDKAKVLSLVNAAAV